jgi:hypothetical protein
MWPLASTTSRRRSPRLAGVEPQREPYLGARGRLPALVRPRSRRLPRGTDRARVAPSPSAALRGCGSPAAAGTARRRALHPACPPRASVVRARPSRPRSREGRPMGPSWNCREPRHRSTHGPSPARTKACRVSGRAMHEVPLPQRALLPVDDEQSFARKTRKSSLLLGLQVVRAGRLARFTARGKEASICRRLTAQAPSSVTGLETLWKRPGETRRRIALSTSTRASEEPTSFARFMRLDEAG